MCKVRKQLVGTEFTWRPGWTGRRGDEVDRLRGDKQETKCEHQLAGETTRRRWWEKKENKTDKHFGKSSLLVLSRLRRANSLN